MIIGIRITSITIRGSRIIIMKIIIAIKLTIRIMITNIISKKKKEEGN